MKQSFIFLGLCMFALSGCGRKEAASAQSKSQPSTEQAAQIESEYILPANKPAAATPSPAASPIAASPSPTQPRPKLAQPVQPIQERINGAIHAQLTVQLRMYIEKNGRMPESFSEFAFRNMDSVPPVPEGMKFVIDPVDKAVKVVKKQP
jgi:hypothetical protein